MAESTDTAVMIPAWINGTLQPVEKLETHLKGLRHKAVSVFVLRDGKILMQQRALGKYHTPGKWANSCCTHPHWEEAPNICAVRRLQDELGITGLEVEFRQNLEYRADVGDGLIEHEVVDVFVAHASDDLEMALNPEEVMAIRWMDFATLAAEIRATSDLFTPWLKIYMRDHADSIFKSGEAKA